MIIYKFPIETFNTADGDVRFSVSDYTLELDEEPSEALVTLIEKFGGERQEAQAEADKAHPIPDATPKASAKRSAKKKGGDD